MEFARMEIDKGVELTPDIQSRIQGFAEKFFPGEGGMPVMPSVRVGIPPDLNPGGSGSPPFRAGIDGVIHPGAGTGGGFGGDKGTGGVPGPGSGIGSPLPLESPEGTGSVVNTCGRGCSQGGGSVPEGPDTGGGDPTGQEPGGGNPGEHKAGESEHRSMQIQQKKKWAQFLTRLMKKGNELKESKANELQHMRHLFLQKQMDQEDRKHALRDIPLPSGFSQQ